MIEETSLHQSFEVLCLIRLVCSTL